MCDDYNPSLVFNCFLGKILPQTPLFACLPKRILKKISDRGNLLCSAFLASLWREEEEIKNICQTVTERQKISNSLSLSFFSVKSLLCCVHTTKSTEEEDGRDDEEEHYCEKQRRH